AGWFNAENRGDSENPSKKSVPGGLVKQRRAGKQREPFRRTIQGKAEACVAFVSPGQVGRAKRGETQQPRL
ncbi:MAG: hypothetical protein N2C14_19920, partial [Planctomycetales bacterium]